MPGQLKPDSLCPECGDPLLMIVDTVNSERLIREYHHDKTHPRVRRRRYCKKEFVGDGPQEYAKQERKGLERRQ